MNAGKLRSNLKEFKELGKIFGSAKKFLSLAGRIDSFNVRRLDNGWKDKEIFRTFDESTGDLTEEQFFVVEKNGNVILPYIARPTRTIRKNGKKITLTSSYRPKTIRKTLSRHKYSLLRVVYLQTISRAEEAQQYTFFKIVILKLPK